MNLNRRSYLKMSSASIAGISLAGCIEPGETINELPRPTLGSDDATVELHVFEDFSCHVCQDYNLNHLPQIKEDYIDEGSVKYFHYDWPIPVHPRWSSEMANAARAVQDKEGNDAYFAFKKLLFENQGNISVDVMRDIAESMDIEDVTYVLESGSNSVYQPVIDADREEGDSLGVSGTPTVFVAGDNFDGLKQLPNYTYDVLSGVIDANVE